MKEEPTRRDGSGGWTRKSEVHRAVSYAAPKQSPKKVLELTCRALLPSKPRLAEFLVSYMPLANVGHSGKRCSQP